MKTGTVLDLDMTTLGRMAGDGWRWWTGEMAAMLPGWALPQRRISGRVLYWHKGVLTEAGGAAASKARVQPVTVLVDPALVLLRDMERPVLGLADLKRLVTLDLDRLTPFAADTAYADAAIVGPGGAPGQMATRIAALPKAVARDVAAAATAQGVLPVAVGVTDAGERTLAFDFAGAMRADGLLPPRPRAARFWWGLVAIAFAVNMGLMIWRDIASVRQVEALVAEQQVAAGAARRLAGAIADEDRRRVDLATRRAAGDALGILARTNRAMPAGAFVERFGWNGDVLRLSGYKAADLDLVRTLRQSGAFTAIRATTADAAVESNSGQPFDVTAQLGGWRMMARLSLRERRLVAILLLVAGLALAWLAIVAPIIDGFAARDLERQRLQAVFNADSRLIASIPRLRRIAEEQRRDRTRFGIAARTPAGASDVLKERIADAVAGAGGQTRSMQDVEAEAGWVRAWAEARLTLPQLVVLLDRVQNQPPLLVVTSLQIAANGAAGQVAANSAGGAATDMLDVRIEIMARHDPA